MPILRPYSSRHDPHDRYPSSSSFGPFYPIVHTGRLHHVHLANLQQPLRMSEEKRILQAASAVCTQGLVICRSAMQSQNVRRKLVNVPPHMTTRYHLRLSLYPIFKHFNCRYSVQLRHLQHLHLVSNQDFHRHVAKHVNVSLRPHRHELHASPSLYRCRRSTFLAAWQAEVTVET